MLEIVQNWFSNNLGLKTLNDAKPLVQSQIPIAQSGALLEILGELGDVVEDIPEA